MVLTGRLGRFVSGKDVILHLIGEIGVDGALYRSLEFTGEGVASLSMDDRLCIANMAIEAGAKNGVFPVDDVTMTYVEGRFKRTPVVYEADPDAVYDQVVTIDLSALRPTVSFPHLPENTKTIDECRTAGENGGPVRIDQVVIGSCTNGRMEDMRAAAEILKDRKVADGVRCIIIPGHAGNLAADACTRDCLIFLWRRAPWCPPPPAAPAWAAIWGSWPPVSALCPPPTGTSWAAWAMWTARFIWPARYVAAASAVAGVHRRPRVAVNERRNTHDRTRTGTYLRG